jgi:hypothetical protein
MADKALAFAAAARANPPICFHHDRVEEAINSAREEPAWRRDRPAPERMLFVG